MSGWISAIDVAVTALDFFLTLLFSRPKASLKIEDKRSHRDKSVVIVRLDITYTWGSPFRINAVRAKEPDDLLISYARELTLLKTDLNGARLREFIPPKEKQIEIGRTLNENDVYDEKIACLSPEFVKKKASKLVLEMTASGEKGEFTKTLTLRVPAYHAPYPSQSRPAALGDSGIFRGKRREDQSSRG